MSNEVELRPAGDGKFHVWCGNFRLARNEHEAQRLTLDEARAFCARHNLTIREPVRNTYKSESSDDDAQDDPGMFPLLSPLPPSPADAAEAKCKCGNPCRCYATGELLNTHRCCIHGEAECSPSPVPTEGARRWDAVGFDPLVPIDETPNGRYVLHSDFARVERERDELEKAYNRLCEDWAAVLNVKTTDGLTSSEWIARTSRALRERDEAKATLIATDKAMWSAFASRDTALSRVKELEGELASAIDRLEYVVDAEQARWQERIAATIAKQVPGIDGSGCDSGDPLDLTATEVSMALGRLLDTIGEMSASHDTALFRLKELEQKLAEWEQLSNVVRDANGVQYEPTSYSDYRKERAVLRSRIKELEQMVDGVREVADELIADGHKCGGESRTDFFDGRAYAYIDAGTRIQARLKAIDFVDRLSRQQGQQSKKEADDAASK